MPDGSPNPPGGEPRHGAAIRPDGFIAMAVAVELSLVPLAWLIEGIWRGPPLEFEPTVRGLLYGLLGAVPPISLLLWAGSSRWHDAGFLKDIRRILRTVAGPVFASMRWWQAALLAAAAGIGEEVLFRGVIQPRVGLAGASILFGLLHPFTPAYTAIAAGLGAYLGWLQEGTRDLLAPVLAHAVYDLVALLLIRKEMREEPDEEDLSPESLSRNLP